ncbi:uncharacterized protein LOC110882015 [Helianthus annuus]|uniref:uncharacterized protein LOC110882015 n=1 Tax=Helianthus annuus TaxID=4232 RepID=UPI000B8FABC6|nr:uncharacterized protein LOC110882015 [Helianthus annuus]
MAAPGSLNLGSTAVNTQVTAPASIISTTSATLSSGPGTTLPFILLPTSQTSEFDAEFLAKNASLLRRLKAQQARDEQILGLRTRLFHDETPTGTMGPTIVTPTFSTVVTSEAYTGYVQGSSGPSPVMATRNDVQMDVIGDPELTKPYHPVSMTAKSKFSARITHAKLPPKLKMPTTVKKYDGTTDPDDHMFDFDGAARVEQWPMLAWCFMFAQTLTGAARVWFDALNEGEINDFEEFRRLFLQNFSQQRHYSKEITEVHNIRRKDGESLDSFIDRFNRESMQISGVVDQLRISGFCHGVRNNQLVEKLHENLPKTMEVLMERARAFARGKNACNPAPESDHKMSSWKKNGGSVFDKAPSGSRGRSHPYGRNDRPPRGKSSGSRFYNLSDLSKTPSEILSAEGMNFPAPPKLRNPGDKNSKKYCDYHHARGHNTDDCWSLKQEIEKAVRSGKLSHLVKEVKEGKSSGENPNNQPAICMIRRANNQGIKRTSQHLAAWMQQPIGFPPVSLEDVKDGPVIVSAIIAGHKVRRVYVDSGSATEIMYKQCFQQLAPQTKAKLLQVSMPLVSFSGEVVQPLGQITLPTTMGEGSLVRTVNLTYLVVEARSVHNVILGRPGMCAFGMISSTIHGALKFPTEAGIATLYSESAIGVAEIRQSEGNAEPPSTLTEEWAIHPHFPEQKIAIGAQLPKQTKKKLWKLLSNSLDVFAWQTSDMVGVPRCLAEHKLNVSHSIKPVAQRKRNMAPARNKAISEDVRKLLSAGIIREVRYQTWVSNPVMVTKKDKTWRMCVDFSDLNNACPKDCYPLPEIDLKIDSLSSFRLKCFLDAYKGYHQIQMASEDEDKTAFVTNEGLFCYTKMPFGLKNAGATYQRLMDKAFKAQIGRNLEIYVDDLVIKSREEDDMIDDILETFTRLRSINLKLNPKKCSFGLEEGKFLGVWVTRSGIQAHPDKIKAVVSMQPPKTIKEIQSLNGKLVALHRFVSKAADRSIPFMSVLKKRTAKGQIEWTPEADSAFQELKVCLGSLPTLTAPSTGETVTVYLSASHFAISAVLVVHRNQAQIPVYYVSRILKDYETRYPMVEKLALALVHASRRLRRYFQAFNIEVQTDLQIQQILRKPEVSGRLTKWAIELSAFDITYRTRGPVKGQAVADFLTEVPTGESIKGQPILPKVWNLYTDGASSKEGSGAGLILIDPEGIEYTYALRFEFKTSNNEAEYEALLAGLQTAAKAGATSVLAHVDSLLVANQVSGEYEAREDNMVRYLQQVNSLISSFDSCKIVHIPRSKNKKADALSKLASVTFCHLSKEVLVETLRTPAIQEMRTVMSVSVAEKSWMTPIVDYLKNGTLPEDKAQARKLKVKALQYQIHDGQLYRKTFLGPLLKCLTPEEASYVIREIHWGICGIHAGPRMVIAKVMNAGYFWPGMHQSAVDELQSCEDCQRHAPVSHRAKNNLVPVTSAWPFQKWGIDIVGPFPVSTGGVRFLLVAIDYFTKWVEAKPLRTITGDQVLRFAWENIVCRFGMPLCIVSDNGKQFAEKPFKTWCQRMNIEQSFASVAHPQANGQVERTNRSIVEGIKKRLGKEGVSWADELPHVLWAHRTMPKTSNKETPFSLTYGTEAVIPAEVGIPTPRIQLSQQENERELRLNLDLIEERRELAAIREAKYKKELEKHYNSKVKETRFKVGEYVMRNNEASLAEGTGKLAPKWEGPYQIKTAGEDGAYTLIKMDGTSVPRTWNGVHLKKCYL